MTKPAKKNRLLEFIRIEQDEYEAQDGNLFSFSLGQALRYYDFISIIFDRYNHVNELAVAGFASLQKSFRSSAQSGILSAEQTELLAQNDQSTTLVHLEIESFYLFAKVFLDKISFFLKDYFGEQNISLVSHHKLKLHLESFRTAKGLVFPENFSEKITYLQDHLVDYRDDEIVHKTSPRNIRGTSYEDNQSGISRVRLYPKTGDLEIHSTPLPKLMLAIDDYIEQIILIISMNRNKSKFRLRGAQPQA